ncbi:CocE/NonD family hydrolase [Williamsia sp.]|uniref:CocE/NonD family hydrolase n=1 Tax=Williamsia sp. TaxID=1872085 RepID=UPI002F947D11
MTSHVSVAHVVDGLHTLVALPDSAPRAVLVVRTPYNAGDHMAEALEWARRGIAVVTQDVRGRYRSPGAFRPYDREGADGLVTLTWVLSQSWCRSPVILYGTSYAAHCAVETAIAAYDAGIDAVAGVSVAVPALGRGETARNVDGSFYLESRMGWWRQHGEGAESPGAGIPDGVLATLPLTGMGRRVDPAITVWGEVIRSVRTDDQRAEKVSALTSPLLAIGGTSDWFAQDTIDLWTSWGGPAALVVGPWDHGLRGSRRADQVQSWIDSVLAGSAVTGARVHGASGNVTDFDRWPSASVSIDLPGGRFRSDPAVPFLSFAPGTDLREAAARSDCLVRELPVPADTIIGTPSVRIDSPAGSGDWSALLAIRRRDGRLEQVAHGMSPHPAVRLTPISVHLETGESMAVIVSAHSFPRHARDLQAGDDHLTGTSMQSAERDVRTVHVELPA